MGDYRLNIKVMKCFLSCSYRSEDKVVVDWFRSFLQAFPLMEILEAGHAPRPPLAEVERKISESQMVCAVLTNRAGTAPSWVSTEIGLAHGCRKLVVCFVEEGIVDIGCTESVTTYKTFNRDTLGTLAAEYISYVFNARSIVLDAMGVTRSELLTRLKQLTHDIGMFENDIRILEAARNRVDDN
jgi:hypothetical protein